MTSLTAASRPTDWNRRIVQSLTVTARARW